MWRRFSTKLQTLATRRSASYLNRFVANDIKSSNRVTFSASSPSRMPFRRTDTLFFREFSSGTGLSVSFKTVAYTQIYVFGECSFSFLARIFQSSEFVESFEFL